MRKGLLCQMNVKVSLSSQPHLLGYQGNHREALASGTAQQPLARQRLCFFASALLGHLEPRRHFRETLIHVSFTEGTGTSQAEDLHASGL